MTTINLDTRTSPSPTVRTEATPRPMPQEKPQPEAKKSRPRILWPDVAKGLSILGVCFLHATLTVPGGIDTFANTVNTWLGPIRLPLFFVVSGLFSYKVRHQSLKQLWNSRLKFLLVPYLVWGSVEIAANMKARNDVDLHLLVSEIIRGECTLWFLHCLILFTLAVWVTKKLPDHWALAASTLPLLWLIVEPATSSQAHLITFLPVYFLGVFMRPTLLALADYWDRWTLWVASFALFLFSTEFYMNLGEFYSAYNHLFWLNNEFSQMDTLIGTIRSLAALPFAVLLCVALSKTPILTKVLSFFGQRTLVIYISHATAMSLLFTWPVIAHNWVPEISELNSSVRIAIIFSLVGLCLAAGWVMEQFKKVPWLGLTIIPKMAKPAKA